MKLRKKNKLPDFNKMTLKEEAKFWDTHSFTDFEDELEDVDIVWAVNKPQEETLSVRLPAGSKAKLSNIAKSKGINVSTLARIWLTKMMQGAN